MSPADNGPAESKSDKSSQPNCKVSGPAVHVRLTREVRFSAAVQNGRFVFRKDAIKNTWSGHTTGHALAHHVALRATVHGPINEPTGYVADIKLVNAALLSAAEAVLHDRPADTSVPVILRDIHASLKDQFPADLELASVEMLTSPYLKYTIETGNLAMVLLTQQFEFSAAHRLHSRDLSDEENKRVFGKCNRPSGHGHNYRVDVTLRCENRASGMPIRMQEFEHTVKCEVIDRFDHKHLDNECDEFRDVTSTVEHIAAAIWNLLCNRFPEGALHNVRVYETPKTWADIAG